MSIVVGRECYACGGCSVRGGRVAWILNLPTNLFLCAYCYKKIICKWGDAERSRRFVRFKGKQVLLDKNPRTGKCSNCGKADGKKTHMHHMYYDESNPLAGTVELCMKCHRVATVMESSEAKLLIANGIVDVQVNPVRLKPV